MAFEDMGVVRAEFRRDVAERTGRRTSVADAIGKGLMVMISIIAIASLAAGSFDNVRDAISLTPESIVLDREKLSMAAFFAILTVVTSSIFSMARSIDKASL